MARRRNPISYYGGKYLLAPKIVAMMPPHTCYVEPFAGGLAVLLAKDPDGISEVVNDIDGELINFWRILQQEDTFEQLRRRLEATPYSREEFEDSCKPAQDPVERAARFFVRIRQSFSNNRRDFCSYSRRLSCGMNSVVAKWLNAINGLCDVHARLRRVLIENNDAINVIRTHDGPDTLFYCDPPYLHGSRRDVDVYVYEMADVEHEMLLNVLSRIAGKFILSGYDSDLYRRYEEVFGWRRYEFEVPLRAAPARGEQQRKQEVLWTNYDAGKNFEISS